MRVFLSHCINTSQNRPEVYRDSEEDFGALKDLGDMLRKDGFRIFEYQFQRSETQTQDILFMMARQITLADAVVFVATRDSYDAPGWTVPELFHAMAHQKEILCCLLRDSKFDGQQFGDPSNPRRFRLLIPSTSPLHTPETLLEQLRALRNKRQAKKELSLFDHADALLEWDKDRPAEFGFIESFLVEYDRAWKSGFRAASGFLRREIHAGHDATLSKISSWIDDDHLGTVWKQAGSPPSVALIDTKTGHSRSAPLPAGVDPLGMGTSEDGEIVIFSHDTSGGITFHRRIDELWESFTDHNSPVVFTGLIGDRWFCGSDFFRLDWEMKTLVRESPTPDDWQRFRRFFWFDPPDPSKSEPFQTLLFSTQPEYWTLLPPHWRSLQGDVEHNKSRLVVWDQSRLFLGDISAEQNFGEGLPKIVVGTKPDSSPHAPSGRGDAPDYLVALCQTRKVPAPSVAPERVESEETLRLFWKAMANKHQTHFNWTLSLDQARAFSKQLLGNPIARTKRPVTRDP